MNMQSKSENEPLILRENLAIDRTVLSNERTLLSYIRTALALLITGLSLLKFFPELHLRIVAFILLGVGVILVIFGIKRFTKVKVSLANYRKARADAHAREKAAGPHD